MLDPCLSFAERCIAIPRSLNARWFVSIDLACIFCRTHSEQRPKHILYPEDYWPVSHLESQAQFENFISKLEAFLNVKRTPINFAKLWRATLPVETDLNLEQFFDQTFTKAAHHDQWEFLSGVINDYKKANAGIPPIFDPQVQYKV